MGLFLETYSGECGFGKAQQEKSKIIPLNYDATWWMFWNYVLLFFLQNSMVNHTVAPPCGKLLMEISPAVKGSQSKCLNTALRPPWVSTRLFTSLDNKPVSLP